jgi:predicted ester cyclase
LKCKIIPAHLFPFSLAGDEQMMVGMYEVMPDLHLTIEDMIAEGDKIAER